MKYQEYIDIINCALKGETLTDVKIDRKMFDFFKDQSLLPLLYLVTKDKRLKTYYYAAFLLHEKYDEIANEIATLLKENNIDFMFLKGYYLRNLYPDRTIRTMGDLDCLILDDNYDKAVSLIKNSGFNYKKENLHEALFTRNNINVEMHHHLINSDIKDAVLTNYVDHLQTIEESFRFEKEFELAYLVYHYSNHMLMAGAGIRPLIDIYLFLKFNTVNQTKVISYLKSLKLEEFYESLQKLIKVIFEKNEEALSEKDTNTILDYIVRSGIHGYANGDVYIGNMMAGQGQSKFKFFLSKMFPKLQILYMRYPKIKEKKLMIPLTYIYHFFTFPFKHFRKAFDSLTMKNSIIEETKNVHKILHLK